MPNVSLGHSFKFKEGFDLKATGIFVILLRQDGFQSNSPEGKSKTITS